MELLKLLPVALAFYLALFAQLASADQSFGIIPIDYPCAANEDCVGQPGRSECSSSDKVCRCLSGYVSQMDLMDCLPIVNELGGDCLQNSQCNQGVPGFYSWCSTAAKTCACASGAINPPEGHQCFPVRPLGQPCTHSVQCSLIGNASCAGLPPNHLTCTCSSGFIPDPSGISKCYKLAQLVGESCEGHQSQCGGLEGTTCSTDKTCDCLANSVPSSDKTKCLPKAVLNEPCEDDAQCSPWMSECRDGGNGEMVCLCGEGYVESKEYPRVQCMEIVDVIGGHCLEDVQCSAGLGPTAACKSYSCQCQFGDDGVSCKSGLPGLGDVCQSHEECVQGVNNLTMCANSPETFDYRCACIPEAVQVGDTCAIKRIGDGCSTDAECAGGIKGEVECDPCTKTCWCRGDLRPSHDWSQCIYPTCVAPAAKI